MKVKLYQIVNAIPVVNTLNTLRTSKNVLFAWKQIHNSREMAPHVQAFNAVRDEVIERLGVEVEGLQGKTIMTNTEAFAKFEKEMEPVGQQELDLELKPFTLVELSSVLEEQPADGVKINAEELMAITFLIAE